MDSTTWRGRSTFNQVSARNTCRAYIPLMENNICLFWLEFVFHESFLKNLKTRSSELSLLFSAQWLQVNKQLIAEYPPSMRPLPNTWATTINNILRTSRRKLIYHRFIRLRLVRTSSALTPHFFGDSSRSALRVRQTALLIQASSWNLNTRAISGSVLSIPHTVRFKGITLRQLFRGYTAAVLLRNGLSWRHNGYLTIIWKPISWRHRLDVTKLSIPPWCLWLYYLYPSYLPCVFKQPNACWCSPFLFLIMSKAALTVAFPPSPSRPDGDDIPSAAKVSLTNLSYRYINCFFLTPHGSIAVVNPCLIGALVILVLKS